MRLSLIALGLSIFSSTVLGSTPSKFQPQVKLGGALFSVELARSPQEWQRGLMFREKLSPRDGMLFIGKVERPQIFWMKNTPVSLDIIFISKTHEIVSIAKKAQPLSEEKLPSEGPAQHVLEILAGQSDLLKLKKGQKVEFINIEGFN